MNLDQKSIAYSDKVFKEMVPGSSVTSAVAQCSFKDGYTQCKTDLIEFLKVNHRASVKDILKHLEILV